MLTRHRLASLSLLTAGCYLSASLWCAAPARAQSDEEEQTELPELPDLRTPRSAPEVVSPPQDDVVDSASYVLGPGDLLAINFWGAQNFSHKLRVDPQGRIFIPNVGFLTAAGKSLAGVEQAVAARARAVYPRLKHGLMLLKPRRFLVQVAGLVHKPGTYPVTALNRVSTVLEQAGGRLPGATQRRIEVRRHGQVIFADLQPFFQLGDRSHNPYLLEGDVVYVPAARLEVAVQGAIFRPGVYELTGDGTLGELIHLAGGLTSKVSSTLQVRILRRGAGDEIETVRLAPPRTAGVERTPLKHGDRVIVPGLGEALPTVLVQGAVGRTDPALAANADKRVDTAGTITREVSLRVPFYEGDTVRTVLERVGGLLPWADGRNAAVDRRQKDGTMVRLPVDAYALIVLRDVTHDVTLKAGDTLYVPAEREAVMVSGPVYRPGLYQYNPGFSARDYVNLAGGPTPNGTISGSKVIGRNGTKIGLDEATTVSPGDVVAVERKVLTTFEWVQILLSLSSLMLSATAIVLSVRR